MEWQPMTHTFCYTRAANKVGKGQGAWGMGAPIQFVKENQKQGQRVCAGMPEENFHDGNRRIKKLRRAFGMYSV